MGEKLMSRGSSVVQNWGMARGILPSPLSYYTEDYVHHIKLNYRYPSRQVDLLSHSRHLRNPRIHIHNPTTRSFRQVFAPPSARDTHVCISCMCTFNHEKNGYGNYPFPLHVFGRLYRYKFAYLLVAYQ